MSGQAIQGQTPSAGSARGGAARGRILAAALRAFGEKGFKAATTREIAQAAGVNLPALKYYFGGKEGLYLACAREIAGRYEDRMLPAASAAAQALAAPMSAAVARSHLKAVIGALAEQLMTDREGEVWTAFALREMADQGPAFDMLYAQLWAPGIELTAQLTARAEGREGPSEADRIRALTLISGLTAFSVARPVALRSMGWTELDAGRLQAIRREIEAQVDRIG
jgi:TetR/AcrR family transcriptional regulator, regulator of cefoperazone and chloramphenicol sensitivity